MKILHLIYASLASTTVWANSVKPLVFFAKISETFEPLSKTSHNLIEGEYHVLSYGNQSADPVEIVVQDGHAFTNQTNTLLPVGLFKHGLAFASFIEPIKANPDSIGKIQDISCYSCDMSHKPHREILCGAEFNDAINCFEVDIYLLKYHESSKSAVKLVPPESPLVFFANVGGILVPLSGEYLGEQFGHLSIFSYGEPSATPVEFNLDSENFAYTNMNPGPGYAVLEYQGFGFGPSAMTRLDLEGGRISNTHFFSCNKPGSSVHRIRTSSNANTGNEYCFEVHIYLLHYDRETGTAIESLEVLGWPRYPKLRRMKIKKVASL